MSDLEFSISGTIPASRKEAFLAAILEALEEHPSVPQIAAGTYTLKESCSPVETDVTFDLAYVKKLKNLQERNFTNITFDTTSPPKIKGYAVEIEKVMIFAVYTNGAYISGAAAWPDQTITVTSTATVTQEQYDTFFSVFEAV